MILAYTALFAWLSIKMVKTDIETLQRNRQPQTQSATVKIEDL